jgi:hypothetical protein
MCAERGPSGLLFVSEQNRPTRSFSVENFVDSAAPNIHTSASCVSRPTWASRLPRSKPHVFRCLKRGPKKITKLAAAAPQVPQIKGFPQTTCYPRHASCSIQHLGATIFSIEMSGKRPFRPTPRQPSGLQGKPPAECRLFRCASSASCLPFASQAACACG